MEGGVILFEEIKNQTTGALLKATNIVGADGGNTISKGKQIMFAVIAVISAIGGLVLIAVAIKDVVVALKGDTKDVHGALVGLGVGIVGGLCWAIAAGATWAAFFQNMGTDFNVVGK